MDNQLYKNRLYVNRIKQQDNYCGVACLCMVLNYYGENYNLKNMTEYFPDSEKIPQIGTCMSHMITAAKRAGYDSKMKSRMTIDDLIMQIDKEEPVIVRLNAPIGKAHSVVVDGYDKRRKLVHVTDPRLSRYDMEYDEFKRLWNIRRKYDGTKNLGLMVRPKIYQSENILEDLNA